MSHSYVKFPEGKNGRVVFHPYLQYPEAFLDHGELCGIALQFQHLSIQETIWCNMAGMLPTRTFDKENMF
jgi:hypothetical protein